MNTTYTAYLIIQNAKSELDIVITDKEYNPSTDSIQTLIDIVSETLKTEHSIITYELCAVAVKRLIPKFPSIRIEALIEFSKHWAKQNGIGETPTYKGDLKLYEIECEYNSKKINAAYTNYLTSKGFNPKNL